MNGYLKTVCDYVHLSPARARLLRSEWTLVSFAWSSLRCYLQPPRKQPAWLRGLGRLLRQARHPARQQGGAACVWTADGKLRRRMADPPGQFKAVERGWWLGDKAFRQELLAQMKEQMGEHHYGEERPATEQARAEEKVIQLKRPETGGQ